MSATSSRAFPDGFTVNTRPGTVVVTIKTRKD